MHFRVSEVYLALAAEFVKVAGSPAVHREFWHASNRQQIKLCLSVGVPIGFVRGLVQAFSWRPPYCGMVRDSAIFELEKNRHFSKPMFTVEFLRRTQRRAQLLSTAAWRSLEFLEFM
jgi:hypothetical protein